jgi:hypothetical protein
LSRRSRRYLRQSPTVTGRESTHIDTAFMGLTSLDGVTVDCKLPARRGTDQVIRGDGGGLGSHSGDGGAAAEGGRHRAEGAQAKEAADDGRRQENDDGKLLTVGSADKTIRLWSIANPARPVQIGAPLTGPAGYVWGLAFSPDGTTPAADVTDGTVWPWDVSPGAAEAQVCADLGQPLTRAEWNVNVPGVPYRTPCS